MSTAVTSPSLWESAPDTGDGADLGIFTTSKVGFFGHTPVVQQASTAAGTDSTTTQALVNALRTAMLNLGLIA